jgi:hypothetical protein
VLTQVFAQIKTGLSRFQVRFAQGVAYGWRRDASTMLEELQALALLALVVTHSFLVRGCIGIHRELPEQGQRISNRIERTSDLLDEMAQLIADLADSIPTSGGSAQPSGGIGELLSGFLMSKMNMASEHGTTQEWEILKANDDPTTLTETTD